MTLLKDTIKFTLLKQPVDTRDVTYTAYLEATAMESVGDFIPSCELKMPPVLNQKNLGACSANACSNALRCLLTGPIFQPSRLFLYYNARKLAGLNINQDTGVCIRDICKSAFEFSAGSETLWPYDPNPAILFKNTPPPNVYNDAETHFMDLIYVSVGMNVVEFLTCIEEGFPIILGVSLYQGIWNACNTGVVNMPTPTEPFVGNHCINICGFNTTTNMFTFQNSWGGVGINKSGLFHIPFNYIFKYGFDAWTLRFYK